MAAGDFYRIVTAAIADIVKHGFDSQFRLDHWLRLIRESALASLMPEPQLNRNLQRSLDAVYRRQVDQRAVLRGIPKSVGRYTLDRIRPVLRAELDRRIAASAQLIRLNRQEAIEKTLRRFSGWATSVPKGGTEAANQREESQNVRKALAQLPFHERRVAIDQGHKLAAAISDVVNVDAGAIAAIWDPVHMPGYDHRPEHLARGGRVFIVPGSWADKQEFFRRSVPRTSDVVQPAVEPFCRCKWIWRFNLRDVPEEFLSAKGVKALEDARSRLRA